MEVDIFSGWIFVAFTGGRQQLRHLLSTSILRCFLYPVTHIQVPFVEVPKVKRIAFGDFATALGSGALEILYFTDVDS